MDKLLHYFIPHPKTHQKAHLLHWHFLLIYFLLFILLKITFDLINIWRPGVLGINSAITVEKVIEETNRERQTKGLPPLKGNQSLNVAASAKAANMFEENYWAHFSPSGKDPWGFIQKAGYKFSYAGENLARNFYTSEDVVRAWMNSPSHRDNILNSRYEDIGIAVVDGVLGGQKTTLVVQMFGRGYQPLAATADVNVNGQKIALNTSELESPKVITLDTSSPLGIKRVTQAQIDPFFMTKVVGVVLITMVSLLLLLDFIVLKRRGVFRLSSHHLAHLSFLAVTGVSIFLTKTGEIL